MVQSISENMGSFSMLYTLLVIALFTSFRVKYSIGAVNEEFNSQLSHPPVIDIAALHDPLTSQVFVHSTNHIGL